MLREFFPSVKCTESLPPTEPLTPERPLSVIASSPVAIEGFSKTQRLSSRITQLSGRGKDMTEYAQVLSLQLRSLSMLVLSELESSDTPFQNAQKKAETIEIVRLRSHRCHLHRPSTLILLI